MKKLTLLAAALLLTAGPALADEWTGTYDVGSTPTLNLSTHDASIVVHGDRKQDIKILVTTDGIDFEEGGLLIEEEVDGDQVTWKLEDDRSGFWKGSYEASVEVHLPAGATLKLATGDGNITVYGMAAKVSAASGDGNITVEDLNGKLSVATGDGNINAINLTGGISAATGDGNIEASGTFTDLNLASGDGAVEIYAQGNSAMDSPWKIATGDGNITINLKSGLAMDVDLDSGDGRIDLDLPVDITSETDTRIKGELNGGGKLLKVRTGDGRITLQPID